MIVFLLPHLSVAVIPRRGLVVSSAATILLGIVLSLCAFSFAVALAAFDLGNIVTHKFLPVSSATGAENVYSFVCDVFVWLSRR